MCEILCLASDRLLGNKKVMKKSIYIIAFTLQFMDWLGGRLPWPMALINFMFLSILFYGIPVLIRRMRPQPFSAPIAVCIVAGLLLTNFLLFTSPLGIPVSLIPPSAVDESHFRFFGQPTFWKLGVGLISTALYAFAHISYCELRKSGGHAKGSQGLDSNNLTK